MKNKFFLLAIAVLLPNIILAQDYTFSISRSGSTVTGSGTAEINGTRSTSSVSVNTKDLFGSGSKTSSSSSRSSSGNNRGSSSSSYSSTGQSSKSSGNYEEQQAGWEKARREREQRERKERERKANIVINNMNKLINNDCIDIKLMQHAIDEFNSLPEDLQKVQGVEGHNARATLMTQKHNMTPIYNKYSLMATNIRELSFGSINTRMMSLSYEDLDKYLKQFLNKHDFERAKVEYQKYEKAKVLEKDAEELYAHLNDKKYLRENCSNIQKLKLIIEQQDALKYVSKYHLFLLKEIEKEVEFDEIKEIPLTVANIKTTLASKEATKNNANWKEISERMTSQRLLSILGLLNTDNDNILPSFVGEVEGNYCFIGKPVETDSKTVEKVYFVSKDGSSISFYETEGVVTNNFFDAKANFGKKKVGITDSSERDVDLNYNAIGGKVTILNTDWHKQIKNNEYRVDEDGTILQYGAEGSVGIKSGISGSANVNLTSNETKNVKADASIGAEVEVAHVGATLAGKWTPVMHINSDNSISFSQYSSSLEGGLSAGASAKFSISKKGVDAKVGLGVSAGVSVAFQDIDGALKQIDSDVVLGIIKSSIDNEYYKSEFDDEIIGKVVVSSIRKEVEKH